MNVVEAAKAWRVHPNTIRRLCKAGTMKAHKKGSAHAWIIDILRPEYQLNTKALAESCGYSQGYITSLIRKGIIKAEQTGTRCYRISLSEATNLMRLRLGGGKK